LGPFLQTKGGFEEQKWRKEFNTKDTKSTKGRTREEEGIEDF
jgi:hypothetical protein